MKFLFLFILENILIIIFLNTDFLKNMFSAIPNKRSSHTKIIPAGTGITFILISILGSLFTLHEGGFTSHILILFICLPLAIIGLIDDKINVSASLRYGAQVITVIYLLRLSPLIENFFKGEGSMLPIPYSMILVLFLLISGTAIINFVNFMDGLDGLVAGCMTVIFAGYAYEVSSSLWLLVAPLMGFLVWNWHPAKIFMGDVGSTFLGAVFVGNLLMTKNWNEFISFSLVASPLLLDSCFCVIRRWRTGDNIFQPHRLHLYQRLNRAGWSHSKVSSLFIIGTALLVIAKIKTNLNWILIIVFIELAIGIYLDKKIAIPFKSN